MDEITWPFGDGTVVPLEGENPMAFELPAVPLNGSCLWRLTGVAVKDVADVVVQPHGMTVEEKPFYLATEVPLGWHRREIDEGVFAWYPSEEDFDAG